MNDHAYVPAHLAIEAMRDNGYKNTAYAIAELMDNAIEAKATAVDLLIAEIEVQREGRRRKHIDQIAVLDNGFGMSAEILRIALQFGNGTHLSRTNRSGIGKFGMGLPASSISQCKKVEVWTWQGGVENAIYSHLDIVEVKNGQSTVPEPKANEIPQMWRQAGSTFGESGTLVVWSNLDRLMWRTANAIIENSEFLIGRMYRKFLDGGKVKIRLASFDKENPTNIFERLARPNDPCYLMADTSCPPPWEHIPMFRPLCEEYELTHTINYDGAHHDVKIRFSYAKEEARNQDAEAGHTLYGKHAKRNVGVTIVRAERELELDQSLVIQYDPRERWWGVEIEFPPALDNLFGVTNNKQSARNLSTVAALEMETLSSGGKTYNEVLCELSADEDPLVPLIEVVHRIDTQLHVLRGLIKAQTRGTRGTQRYDDHPTPEETATTRTRERQQQGHTGESDADEQLPSGERKVLIQDTLVEEGVSERDAGELAATTVTDNLKYLFANAPLETAAFFSVKPRGGAIIITLNTEHPAFDKLVEVLEEKTEGQDASTLVERLSSASDGLKLLLTAWARYEDELPDGMRKQNAQDARNDWGRVARNFLAQDQ